MSESIFPEHVRRLDRDLAQAARTLSDAEARFLVDAYYIIQEDRKRSVNQVRALGDNREPNSVLDWFAEQNRILESQIQRALDKYTEAHRMGEYMRSTHGIGPVISAGLLAYIDIKKAPTVGHIWSFAGWLGDKQRPWEAGMKRPYCTGFRTLLYKAGESFVKFSGDERCYYGHIWRQRKEFEIRRNDEGLHVDQARKALERNIGKTTEAYKWYIGCFPAGASAKREQIGRGLPAAERIVQQNAYLASVIGKPKSGLEMLPPAHVHARARRYAVKLFLAHLHDVWWEAETGTKAPLPYPIAILGHSKEHYIPPPPRNGGENTEPKHQGIKSGIPEEPKVVKKRGRPAKKR